MNNYICASPTSPKSRAAGAISGKLIIISLSKY